MGTPFHLDAVRPLPSASAEVGQDRIGRVIFVGSDYEAYALSDALNVLSERAATGGGFEAPELVCMVAPESVPLAESPDSHDLWLLHSATVTWSEANELAEAVKTTDPKARAVLLSDDRRVGANHREDLTWIDRVFIWHGQPSSLLAVIWLVQDEINAEEEMAHGLPLLLLIEDRPDQYSTFVPLIYREIVERTLELVGPSARPELIQAHLRMRPRVLLAQTMERALTYLGLYSENLLGIISDTMFPAGRDLHPRAGLVFVEAARCVRPTVPIIVQSTSPNLRDEVKEAKAHFLLKRSDRWLSEVRRFMLESFGFGDFIFRDSEERELLRVSTLRELREGLATVPLESLLFHARRYHFSTWLFNHGAYELARKLRPLGKKSEDLRIEILVAIDEYLAEYG